MKEIIRLEVKLLPLKYPVYCIVVCLILLVVPGCGVEVCESEDANLLFPNTPASFAGDIRAKTWNKENGIRLASWMTSTNFVTNPSYGDRLMAIGENSIKIRNTTRNDTGNYTLVQTSGSSQHFIETTVYLYVIVPPSNQCILNITREVDNLWAVLPLEGCGIPRLKPNWVNGTQKLTSDHISVLEVNPGYKSEVYIACAVGNSKHCIHVDSSNLCKNYTVSALPSQNESSSMLVVFLVVIIIGIIFLVIGLVICMVCRKRKSMKGKLNSGTNTTKSAEETEVEIPLMDLFTTDLELAEASRTVQEEKLQEKDTTPVIGMKDIQRHLIDQYKAMMCVALSACYEEDPVDVSQVYCELEIRSLGVENEEGTENVISDNKIFSSMDAESVRPVPAIILGECGSGKTTWCKNLVYQWCQYRDNKDSKLDMKVSFIHDISRFEILLYIQLKKKLEDLSFMEHVKNTLFANDTGYFEYTRCCILEHRVSVLLLIDGLDEVACSLEPIVNLLKEKEKCPCSVVLTSRPSGLECWQEKDGRSLQLFKIHGMRLESSKEYARKVLDMLSRTRGEKLDVNQFWKFVNHVQVLSMCHIPFFCLSLIFIWIKSKSISADLTDVLLMIVEYYLRRAMMREWYKVNIGKVIEQQQFDISGFIAKTKNAQYLRDHSYILKVISGVARNLWCVQMDVDIDKKSIEKETKTVESGSDVNDLKICLQTGILLKTFRGKLERTRSEIIFSHPLLFDLFVALSIAIEKGESFRRCITTKKAVFTNSNMIHMLCQVAPNIGQELIRDISKLFEKDRSVKTEESDQKLICNIESNDPKHQGGAPVKWLKSFMYMDELSNAKLSILTEGLKFTEDLSVFVLQVFENKKELVFRLPILSKLQALKVDIGNCTLLLDEEQEWNKGNVSELVNLVIKSVNIDVKTTGYIMEAVSICKHLRTLELCPKGDSDAQVLALSSKKTFYGWGRLAEGIKDMSKLNTVRLHNLQIREYLPALLESLCKCPTIEMLDLMNLSEIDTGKILKVNAKDQDLYGCKHQEAERSENLNTLKIIKNKRCKTVQLIKNAMSEKSWQALSVQLESLSPRILHIEQVHQSSRVVNELLQGICKCKDLEVLSICSIHAGTHPVSFFGFRQMHKLAKFTFCNITMPDSSWKELSDILARLSKLKELSLAHLEIKNCFIEVHKLSKVKLLELKDVHLDDELWSKFGDEVMTLPNLKTLELVSCMMSKDTAFLFSEKMNHSVFNIQMEKKSKVADTEMMSIDMIVTFKRK